MTTSLATSAIEPIANGTDESAPAARRRQIEASQLSQLAGFGVWCQFVWVLLGSLIAGFHAGLLPAWHIQGFVALDLAGVGALGLLVHRFRRAQARSEDHDPWGSLFTLTFLIVGAIWGAAGIFLFVPDSPAHQAFLALSIVGMASLSATCLTWHMPAFLAFAIASVVPISLRFIMDASAMHFVIGAMSLAYLVLLIGLGWLVNRRFTEFVAQSVDNERRIERLLTGRASENAVQARLETALESMSEGLAVFDAEDRLVICNRQFFGEQQAGGAPDITAKTFEELVRQDLGKKPCRPSAAQAGIVNAKGREEKYIAERIAYHRKLVGTFEVERSDGRWFQIRDRRTADGGTVVVQTDITAHKRAEEVLRSAKDRAEWANRAKSEFLTNTSHELRTPLNAIIGFAQMMEAEMFGELGSQRYRDYTKNIRESGEHLLSVVNDLLDLSKIEAGKQSLHDELVTVPEAVQTAWKLAKACAEGAHPALVTDMPVGLPKLRADKRLFQQIVLNFLSNAVKFTSADGKIETIARIGRDGTFVLQIVDTGIGMNQDDLKRAFEPFGQGNGGLTRNHEGTGLGVPLSKALIELHGGTLDIDSEPGSGTTVTVRFPENRVVMKDHLDLAKRAP